MLLGLEGTEPGFDVSNLFLSYHITNTSTEERNEEILSTHYSNGNFRGTFFVLTSGRSQHRYMTCRKRNQVFAFGLCGRRFFYLIL